MASSGFDWEAGGGDYSFLMSSIEGTIANSNDLSPIRGVNDSFNSTSSPHQSSKRSRLSIDNTDFGRISRRSSSNTQFVDTLKSLAEVDELKIANEQLSEQLKDCKMEHALAIDKISRQMKFLEEQNNRHKAESESRLEKFFEEKKKWQLKIRELEHANKQLANAPTQNNSSSASAVAISNQENAAAITNKLKQFEKEILCKSKELKEKSVEVIELQHTVATLQQELKLQHAIHPDDALGVESEEVKELQRTTHDLEMKLKRKSREYEKLEQKLHNQHKLEEELAHSVSQLKIAQERIKRFESMEGNYQKLCDEKSAWKLLFQNIMNTTHNNAGDMNKEVTPTNVLRLLSTSQEKCSLLLRTQSELELNISKLQSQLSKSETKLREVEQSNNESTTISTALTKRNTILAQQVSLYEGEVASMRSLLQTYDIEFSLGKVGLDKVLKLKNEQISSLQSEIDKARNTGVSLGNKVLELESKQHQQQHGSTSTTTSLSGEVSNIGTTGAAAESSQSNHTAAAETVSALKMEVDMLRMELEALQEISGMDFIPGKTKVLHMIHNPASAACKSPSTHSTLPMDELRRLRRELKSAISVVGETGDASGNNNNQESGVDANQSMNMSMIGKPVQATAQTAATPAVAVAAVATADMHKMNQRLKEMFKERITAFREAVYLLTGYKIDLYSAETNSSGQTSLPRLRLRSMYSDSADDSLLFQWKGDTLELLETEFASNLDPKLFASLTACNSVPAFLSNVTLELFERQTFIGR